MTGGRLENLVSNVQNRVKPGGSESHFEILGVGVSVTPNANRSQLRQKIIRRNRYP